MSGAYVLTRDVRRECPWVPYDWRGGQYVYLYHGPTYGCIGPTGIAVSRFPNATPFYEVPSSALAVAR